MRHVISRHEFARQLDDNTLLKGARDGARRKEKEAISTRAKAKISAPATHEDALMLGRPRGEHALRC
jgi:hypothetical protein